MNLSFKLIFLVFLFIVFNALNISPVNSQTQQIRKVEYEGELVEYFKNKLILYLQRDKAAESTYLKEVNEYINLHGGKLDSISKVSIWYIAEIQFADSSADAVNIIDDFKNSGLFEYVYLDFVIRLNELFDPNNSVYSENLYLKIHYKKF
ncbi:MAG TPA: hypothetical protein PK294_08090 [Ignavibacteria bacterium]|nr:hypothetical protein [Ignavibacteria bacterium]HQY51873.1 hypothetical protein [Ignavibacteria bacterium]HRB00378.1 hypothetical protein [Ignavibacteria bacterium]